MKKVVFLVSVLVSFLSGYGQEVNSSYLIPTLGDSSIYKFLRFGASDDYKAGFMWNNSDQGFGDGDDFSIFTYANRDLTLYAGTGDIILSPKGTGKIGIGTVNPLAELHVIGQTRVGNQGTLVLDWTHQPNWGGSSNAWAGYIGFNAERTDGDLKDHYRGPNKYTSKGVIEGSNFGFRWLYRNHQNYDSDGAHQLVEHMRLTNQGKLGIGITNPEADLDVAGTIKGNLIHNKDYLVMKPYSSTYDDGTYAKLFYDGNNRAINFWNSDGNQSTKLRTGGISIKSANSTPSVYGFNNFLEFSGSHGAIVFNPGQNTELMFGMHSTGNFYWGTGRSATKPDHYLMQLNASSGNLGIKGKLTSSEVKVKLGGWADYVFEDTYNLPTLHEVERHITEKGHLINIPSAAEVAKEGIYLGEMNAKLLEKIEELTLYTIAQEKRIKELENRDVKIFELERKIERLLKDKN